MKIGLISEHASPLAIAGGVDSGGQNIYVANVARQLVRLGHDVDVFTRCDRSLLPLISRFETIRVINVRRAFSLLCRELAEVIHIEKDAKGQAKWQNLDFD